ncbi:DUF2922 domain-containing protein [Clostridium saccharobutylicum]|uniref:DUF2922 domain-containing protein n=1 Tax=Clostridium saccharobutylicum DSM 13864 TaxID=1345695 RepID=U5MYD5_CLOSA|nr:DUF2922 domain-containing protein [Clostridium saccharobutylicum]AGX44472.1 hypothetical protein CLSA_c35110 [Clostridium saccharobutylicum DSM 13864]AQR91767.1 hypothetical protein CLOSC_34950 [Clostridium saccharobutylicum]AQS01669.1 hypothetical protein CSACC_35000 [Clostridium saccharobutylicum]AQS11279.1 hypothetical protein CLOBY_34350 [Clostridium saccharobutylicum]AQS15652.1 hypothetical protein CLOSACC_35000 [Clostridium saccharobutylicum]
MEYVLSMTFLTENGLKSSLSINGVKADLDKDQVNTLMDTIIAKNIFVTNSGALVSKSEAKVTERKVTKFEVK